MSQTIVETYCPLVLPELKLSKIPPSEPNSQVIKKMPRRGGCNVEDDDDDDECDCNTACIPCAGPRYPTCGGPDVCGVDTSCVTIKCRIIDILETIREPLAEYQEKDGMPKDEHYGFLALLTSLCQHAYGAAVTIFAMLYNLLPLLDGFLYLARFILDKLIDIFSSCETSEIVLKSILFFMELGIIAIIVVTICGFILFPVWCLFSILFGKIWAIIIANANST